MEGVRQLQARRGKVVARGGGGGGGAMGSMKVVMGHTELALA